MTGQQAVRVGGGEVGWEVALGVGAEGGVEGDGGGRMHGSRRGRVETGGVDGGGGHYFCKNGQLRFLSELWYFEIQSPDIIIPYLMFRGLDANRIRYREKKPH